MPERRKPVERAVGLARNVNGWLGLLGSNCCAGRSYRRFDDVKGRDICDAAEGDDGLPGVAHGGLKSAGVPGGGVPGDGVEDGTAEESAPKPVLYELTGASARAHRSPRP
ncbi:MAG TPA: hypothetical protein VK217_09395 [Acidimicrobiales bacterium]|nr:hypothetical protein [Acidimicrobiales bacterium]